MAIGGTVHTAPAGRVLNSKLEAFKQLVQNNKTKRHEEFQERISNTFLLSEQLRQLSLSEDQKEAVRKCFNRQQDEYFREMRKQVTISDFDRIRIIGKGAFGIVWLCRQRDTGGIFAMKQMNKNEMVCKNQIHHVRAEKDALSKAKGWVSGLHHTFQDDRYLYMVMDYLPGGDLMTHLIRKDTFSEDEARFYVAELVEAVDYIHTELHYIHRDLKPDNIVLDSEGHIHLLDFGLCKHTPSTAKEADSAVPSEGAPRAGEPKHPSRAHLQSVVGTPDYRGPEVYGQEPYGKECDWWSVGCILFEMLCGGPPFSDDDHDARVTEARVQRWWEHYRIPDDVVVSPDAEDLLRKLICDPKDRLGADQIRVHPFFQGIDFAKLRQMTPPIRPVVTGPTDTSNFDDFGQENARYPLSDARHHIFKDPSLFAFHDYSFRRDLASKKPSVIAALKSVG
jgi:serine/threonine kinase 38